MCKAALLRSVSFLAAWSEKGLAPRPFTVSHPASVLRDTLNLHTRISMFPGLSI